MPDIRKRIEKGFESFARFIYRNSIKTALLVLALAAAAVSQLPKIAIDTSTEGFLHKDDPTLLEYNAFREQFGRDEMIIIALNPPEVFDMGFMEKLRAFHSDLLESVPHLDDITSLVNARNTRGEEDSLVVEDLFEDWPESEAELAMKKERALSNPLYKNLLVSEDGAFTTVVIKTNAYSTRGDVEDILAGFEETGAPPGRGSFLTDEENSAVVRAVREVMERHRSPEFSMYLAGSPVVTDTLKRSMLRDMKRFMALVLASMATLLFVMFRRASGVVLPLAVVAFSLFTTLGLMAASGVPLKLPTQILPSFLLAVGVGASVHILAIFYRRFDSTGDRQDALAYAMGHSGLAVAMTGLTTAGGLISFATADIAPIADLGFFASTGVMASLFYTVVLLPALISLLPLKARRPARGPGRPTLLDRALSGIGDFATGRPVLILAVSAALLALSIAGAARIRFSHNVLGWLDERLGVRVATEKIDSELRGSISMEVVLDTGRTNGLYEPDTLKALDRLGESAKSYTAGDVFVGKTLSVADILKEIHRALNEDRQEFYAIPEDRELIAQEFLLFENSGSDDLEDVVDSQFSKARFTLKVPFLDAIAYGRFMKDIEGRFHETFGDDVRITVTGLLPLLSRTLYNVMLSMAKSYVIAAVVITLLMLLLIGELRLGLLSMVPNLAPIVLTLGIMGWFGLPMDMFTMLVGSIAIGLAVDDTIHFMHNFRRYFAETGDVREAVHRTLQGTGRAMLVTSCVLSLGFFIFMLSSMNNLFRFGLLTGLTIVFALLADYFIAPALMALAAPARRKTGENKGGL
jgi:predicted RND superfamily exporter protein